MTQACISAADYTLQINIGGNGVTAAGNRISHCGLYINYCLVKEIEFFCFCLLRVRLTLKTTLIAGEMLEDFRARHVDHLADLSSQPAPDIVPHCFTSCKHRQREKQGHSVSL